MDIPGHSGGQAGGSRTWSESGQGAVLVQPSQGGLAEALQACRGHHPIEGLEQRPNEDAELGPGQGAGLLISSNPPPAHV